MKTSVIIPVFNEAHNIPPLVRALKALGKKNQNMEILFVDNASTDGSADLLRQAALPNSKVLSEPRRGFAEPLNKALGEAIGEWFLFLDADAIPEPGWAEAMLASLSSNDLVVGQTVSSPMKKPTAYGKLAAKLFEGHSERTAHARGHALPWGPTCNLGARRSLVEKVGPFSPEAHGAFDIDWCWRAILKGARIRYCKEAKVQHARRNSREQLLEQFERYGAGEAWLHRTYSFLLAPEDQETNPIVATVEAFRRLRHQSEAAGIKSLSPVLEEVAAAFSAGVRLGYDRPHRECPLERSLPNSAINWPNGAKSVTVFVPGKGLATLEGKQLQLWEAMQAGDDEATLVHLFQKLFRTSETVAHHELEHFRENLEP